MSLYLLDTNTISDIVRGRPSVTRQAATKPDSALQMSVITQAEVLFGLAKRPQATRIRQAVRELMPRVTALPWDSAAAEEYARLRALSKVQAETSLRSIC